MQQKNEKAPKSRGLFLCIPGGFFMHKNVPKRADAWPGGRNLNLFVSIS
jgi:hypothetical protein